MSIGSGPTSGIRTRPGSASSALRSLRFATSSVTRRFSQRNATTTKLEALQAAAERLEEGKKFDTTKDYADRVSSFFQVSVDQHFADSADAASKILRTN